jgi:hypothetical protein
MTDKESPFSLVLCGQGSASPMNEPCYGEGILGGGRRRKEKSFTGSQ